MVYIEFRSRQSTMPLFEGLEPSRVIRIERTWERAAKLHMAASFHPNKTPDAVLSIFMDSRPDCELTPENLDEFLLEYIRKGIIRVRAETEARQEVTETTDRGVPWSRGGVRAGRKW